MTEQQTENPYIKSDWGSIAGICHFSHEAMAAPFEIVIQHKDGRYAGQAAAAAFNELDRLEANLSRFIENSDISRINHLAAHQPLRIGLDVFECLKLSAQIYAQTNGTFDVTIGSLVNCLLDKNKSLRRPSDDQLNLARRHTGMNLVKLDEQRYAAELLDSQVQIDLGGIGKGFAVGRMAELLRDWSIDVALISGGYSSVLALEAPFGTEGWPVTFSHPLHRKQTLTRFNLRGRAVSASGLQKGQHIIDPRTALPVDGKVAAWACAADAGAADALSTAFMVMNVDEIGQYCSQYPEVQAMVILQEDKEPAKEKILRFGQWQREEQLK